MALDKDEASARVLEVAERLIEAGGTDQLKARTVAAKAGIAVGSVYNLYSDMDTLHVAVNLKLIAGLEAAGLAAIGRLAAGQVTDTRECLMELARTYLDYVDTHRNSWLALIAFPNDKIDPAKQHDYLHRLDSLMSIISRVLLRDPSLGLNEEAARVTARVLWSSVHGIVTNSQRSPALDPDLNYTWRLIDHLVTVFLVGLRAQASAPG